MLVSASLRLGADPANLPKTKSGDSPKLSYPKHPTTIWHGDSYCNFLKGADFGLAICQEYTKRYGKIHFCESGIKFMRDNIKSLIQIPFQKIEMTPYAVAISTESKCRQLSYFDRLHVIDKYRMYYLFDKKDIATWKFTEKPYWFDNDYIQFIGESYGHVKQDIVFRQEYLCQFVP